MSSSDAVRILLALIAVFGALFTLWWVPALCMLLLSLRFRAWEVPLIGLFVDFLWLPSGALVMHFPLFAVTGIVVVWLFEPMRNQLLL